jgi:hypothetical protein
VIGPFTLAISTDPVPFSRLQYELASLPVVVENVNVSPTAAVIVEAESE